MLRKIYHELAAIRKELQAVRSSLEGSPQITIDRAPYERCYHASLRQPNKGR